MADFNSVGWTMNTSKDKLIEHGQQPASVQYTPPVRPAGTQVPTPPAGSSKAK